MIQIPIEDSWEWLHSYANKTVATLRFWKNFSRNYQMKLSSPIEICLLDTRNVIAELQLIFCWGSEV